MENNNYKHLYDELSQEFSSIDESIIQNIVEKFEHDFIPKIDKNYFSEAGFCQKFYDELEVFITNHFDDSGLLEYILNQAQDYSITYLTSSSLGNNLIAFGSSFLDYIQIKSYFSNIDFEQSLQSGFYPISFSKMNTGYSTRCITSNGRYHFKILDDGAIQKGLETHFDGGDVQNFLEQEQTVIKMGGLNVMGQQGSNDNIQLIPIEKIKKLDLESLDAYLKELEKDIEDNREEYTKRVSEIIQNGSVDL